MATAVSYNTVPAVPSSEALRPSHVILMYFVEGFIVLVNTHTHTYTQIYSLCNVQTQMMTKMNDDLSLKPIHDSSQSFCHDCEGILFIYV